MKGFTLCVLTILLPATAFAELIVFKRYTDNIVVPKSHIDYTVWLLDAPNVILDPINEEGKDVVDPEEQERFKDKYQSDLNSDLMQALVMISFVARAKANKYGVTVVPSAVQVDRDGTVVRVLSGRLEIERYLGELDDK